MENQTKYRILGILVIIGLVIIVMPFFQNNHKDEKTTKTLSTDQKSEANSETITLNEIPVTQLANAQESPFSPDPDDGMIDTALPEEALQKQNPIPVNTVQKITEVSQSLPGDKPLSTKNTNTQSVQLVQAQKVKPSTTVHKINIKAEAHKTTIVSHKKPIVTKHLSKVYFSKNTSPKSIQPTIDKLTHLKKSAWVIQVGSFQNRVNALRILRQLRQKGYSAFLQEMSLQDGEELRIYVGPEQQRKSAIRLRNQIKKDAQLQGIVIKYQPLA
jgi:DedD protein